MSTQAAQSTNKEESEKEETIRLLSINTKTATLEEKRQLFDKLREDVQYYPFGNNFIPTKTNENGEDDLFEAIKKGTKVSYNVTGIKEDPSDELLEEIMTPKLHAKCLMLLLNMHKVLTEPLINEAKRVGLDLGIVDGSNINIESEDPNEWIRAIEKEERKDYMEAVQTAVNKLAQEDPEILQIMDTFKDEQYGDIVKLRDRYAIRLGYRIDDDDEFFVSSNEVKSKLVDQSENPSWALWHLSGVPSANIPNRAELFMQPETEERRLAKEVDDDMIVCHASLWKIGNHSGVILHTAWRHITATYRWKIDKSFEIASLMFKTSLAHPAHIARAFGQAPIISIPGDEFF